MTEMTTVPALRVRNLNERKVRPDGDYVLYWMVANRRTRWNFSLQRAAELAAELKKPLLIFEALRCGYEWASDRLHRFVIEGMLDNHQALAESTAGYYPWLEKTPEDGRGLLTTLAASACAVVTDDFPCFFLPRMQRAAAAKLSIPLEVVDSNGILPLRAADRVFPLAHTFRRFLQKTITPHLEEFPVVDPLSSFKLPKFRPSLFPKEVREKWPAVTKRTLQNPDALLAKLPIDHAVKPTIFSGGRVAAAEVMGRFFEQRFSRYADDRNATDNEAASGLSPYLHFGHISSHEIVADLFARERWSPDRLAPKPNGSREGWWGMSRPAESFLDELITWREVGYNMSWQTDNYHSFESLPDWAQTTLAEHENDPRPFLYSAEEFETAATHDEVWNAAQRQLVREGRMHNYLRMLWGKKILEWSPTPRDAADTMVHLNNKYAVDGRNPNSYSGIYWVLGRYDRAWGPERPIFGKIRYMSSDSAKRKLKLANYLAKYAAESQDSLF